nr:carbonic anhydrase 2-like [Dermacentor andersoni]
MGRNNVCGGSFQSPINITTNATIFDSSLGPVKYTNYSEPMGNAVFENNGHTVTLTPAKASNASVSIDGLPSTYNFKQLHFHWGDKSTEGSEHHVDGKSYAMEMHLVHINTEYGSAREAYKHPDGLLVVGVLFKVDGRENWALRSVVTALRQMNKRAARRVRVPHLASLVDLLPLNPSLSYLYRGSLTTPPCSEAVIWAVLKNEEKIGKSQVECREQTAYQRRVSYGSHEEPSSSRWSQPTASDAALNNKAITKEQPCDFHQKYDDKPLTSERGNTFNSLKAFDQWQQLTVSALVLSHLYGVDNSDKCFRVRHARLSLPYVNLWCLASLWDLDCLLDFFPDDLGQSEAQYRCRSHLKLLELFFNNNPNKLPQGVEIVQGYSESVTR